MFVYCETDGDLRTISKQQSSASSASAESAFHNRSSSIAASYLNSLELVHGNSSSCVSPEHSANRNLGDVNTGLEAVKECHSSTYSQQVT